MQEQWVLHASPNVMYSCLQAATSKNDDTAPLQESSDDEFWLEGSEDKCGNDRLLDYFVTESTHLLLKRSNNESFFPFSAI